MIRPNGLRECRPTTKSPFAGRRSPVVLARRQRWHQLHRGLQTHPPSVHADVLVPVEPVGTTKQKDTACLETPPGKRRKPQHVGRSIGCSGFAGRNSPMWMMY